MLNYEVKNNKETSTVLVIYHIQTNYYIIMN